MPEAGAIPGLRRTLLHVETVHAEDGRTVAPPTRLVAALAILANPWAGRGHVADLGPEIRAIAPALGGLLTEMILGATGGTVEGYGKASLVGTGGALEHARALTHTLHFGNRYREAVGAATYLAFANTRGGPGAALVIPLMDKDDGARRSHYQTIHLSVPDAPAADEVIVALGASLGGAPHHRIGDRAADLAEMGRSADNPAGV